MYGNSNYDDGANILTDYTDLLSQKSIKNNKYSHNYK